MQFRFKRHQAVLLKLAPNPEYVEYHEDCPEIPIKSGMRGKINLVMPNGEYHVVILDDAGNVFAYALMREEELEAL